MRKSRDLGKLEDGDFVFSNGRVTIRAVFQIAVYRTVLSLYFSVSSDRKVPKEHRQRAGRPLDTRLLFMGLFDRGYTRRGIRKALRKSLRRRFSHAPPNSTQGGRGLSILSNHGFCRAGGGARYPLSMGRQPPLPFLRARNQGNPLGETIHFPTELGSQPRGRHSDGHAAPWQTAT